MKEMTKYTEVGTIARNAPGTIQLLQHLGIDFCCGGSKPLEQACDELRLDVDAVLKLLFEASSKSIPTDDRDWNAATLQELCLHIVNKHHAYVREGFRQLTPMLAKVVARHGEAHPELAAIQRHWQELMQELTSHMAKEEEILFPFVTSLEHAATGDASCPASCFGTVQNPIRMMMTEHDRAGELLKQIRLRSNDYIPPSSACNTYIGVLHGLKEFEQDLHVHIHLENNILFPRTVELEQKVMALA